MTIASVVCRIRLWLIRAALVLVLGPALAPAAWAHAALLAVDPAEGAILDAAPARVVLHFSEAVRPIVGRLTFPDQSTVLLAASQTDATGIMFDLPAITDKGSYLLSWRVSSSDGHPVAGAALFSIGHASELTAEGPAAPPSTRIVLWAARAVLVAGLLIGVGGVAFASGTGQGVPRLSRLAVTAGLVALPVVMAFQGLDLLGAAPPALAGSDPWREALQGSPALALLLALLSLTLAYLVSAGRVGRVAALAALALAAGSAAATGHAATAVPQVLTRPAVLLHVLAAAFWLGAFAPLIAALARGQGAVALHRFGAIIPWALATLIASGIALSVVQLETVEALWITPYGRVLIAKLLLVAILLALGAWNRISLTPRAESGAPGALIRSIRLEIALSLAIIAVLGLWRFTVPPRNIVPPPVGIVQQVGDAALSAQIRLSSNRAGPMTVALSDLRLDGRPFTPIEVRVEFTKPAFGLGPFSRTLPGAGDVLEAGSFILPMDGFWVLRLHVLVDDFRSEEIVDIVTLEPVLRAGR